ncbi:MAG TPA: Trm112 family protein [Woeseiaceae bacterium]|nr:Trm112 family protein [Woeseiaceae bacterium]
MDKRLLAILCCPVTHKGLSVARPDLLKKVNTAIGSGKVVNREGSTVDAILKEALVTDDSKLLYPVKDGIPVLLEAEGISLGQLEGL